MSTADDDEQEYQRLLHFMTRPGPRFGMALARYADANVAQRMRERVVVEAATQGYRVATVNLSGADDRVDLVARLRAAIGEGDDRLDVLLVAGIEPLLVESSGQVRHSPAVANLNQRRDTLPQLLDARIVWWIAEWAYAGYATRLRDLSEVTLTTVQFRGRAETHGELQWMTDIEPEQRASITAQAERLQRLHDRASDVTEKAELAASVARLWASLAEYEPARNWFKLAADEFERAGQLDRAAGELARLAAVLPR